MKQIDLLIPTAQKFVGVKEKTGNNDGPEIEMFQKFVDGVAQGEPYCCAFVQYCVGQVDKQLGTKTVLFKTESCMTLWDKTPTKARLQAPERGCVVIWQFIKDGKPTTSGHAGIVTNVTSTNAFDTVEGNTSDGSGINREGDGVYARTRLTQGSPTMKVVGFLRPWLEDVVIPEPVKPIEVKPELQPLVSTVPSETVNFWTKLINFIFSLLGKK